jgi:hypothetical protein
MAHGDAQLVAALGPGNKFDEQVADAVEDSALDIEASQVDVDSATLVGTATDVQGSLEELDNAVVAAETATSAHVSDTDAAHAASAVSASSTSLVGTGTTVQAVLEDLDNGLTLDNQVQAVAGVTATAVDASLGHVVTIAMGTDATQTVTISNLTAGQSMTFFVTQNGAGSKALVFASTFFAGGTEPTMTATADAVDCYTVINIGGQLYGFVAAQDLKT